MDVFSKETPPLPQFPVAYMVLFAVRRRIDVGNQKLKDQPGADAESVQQELLNRLRALATHYMRTRTEPLMRHLSDVQREYAVVARLSCACGKGRHSVEFQALHVDDQGRHFDKLTVRCASCKKATELSFPLPHFGDLKKVK
jgi:hypothetical protein